MNRRPYIHTTAVYDGAWPRYVTGTNTAFLSLSTLSSRANKFARPQTTPTPRLRMVRAYHLRSSEPLLAGMLQ